MPDQPAPKTCFVVMGFGTKTDFKTGKSFDLNMSYFNMIKPAVQAAGLTCVRADEINHSGVIDVPMYRQLLEADVVVADISTSNVNAFYELGIRHALRPHTTVIVAEDGMDTLAFDLSHVVVRKYRHLGEDIGFKEANRFRDVLTTAIRDVLSANPRVADSPVYTFLHGLTPPELADAVEAAVKALPDDKSGETLTRGADTTEAPTYAELFSEANEAQAGGEFLQAKILLNSIRKLVRKARRDVLAKETQVGELPINPTELPEDPSLIRRLALVTYKSEHPTKQAALEEARALLLKLDPQTSNDTETLGLWGAVNKRHWELSGDAAYLDEAVRGYENGFKLRNDYYNGINYAYLLNVRAAQALTDNQLAEACTDFVLARRVRREVLEICHKALEAEKVLQTEDAEAKPNYWLQATLAEAYVGLGKETEGQKVLDDALALKPAQWMRDSTEEQLAKLRALLAKSPLKHIRIDALSE